MSSRNAQSSCSLVSCVKNLEKVKCFTHYIKKLIIICLLLDWIVSLNVNTIFLYINDCKQQSIFICHHYITYFHSLHIIPTCIKINFYSFLLNSFCRFKSRTDEQLQVSGFNVRVCLLEVLEQGSFLGESTLAQLARKWLGFWKKNMTSWNPGYGIV
jgi:hypothetical protein